MFVYLNNRLLPAAEARISVFDRGFTYGDSLFETVRVIEGRPVFLPEHLERLRAGMQAALFPGAPNAGELHGQALTLAARNNIESGRLRIQVSRGTPATPAPAGPDPADETQPTWLVTLDEFPGVAAELYELGVSCVTVPASRGRYASLKSAGLLGTFMARQEGHAAGAWETILTDREGRMLEGTFSNVFFLAGKLLVTAAEEEAVLPGVVRRKVLEMAPSLGLALQVHAPRMEELGMGATSAFLTSSLLGICPVREINGVRMQPDPGEIALLRQRLAELEKLSRLL